MSLLVVLFVGAAIAVVELSLYSIAHPGPPPDWQLDVQNDRGQTTESRDGIVEVRRTAHAFRHGLALALPESVSLQKRPRQDSGPRMQSIVRIPVAGRDAWETAARRSA